MRLRIDPKSLSVDMKLHDVWHKMLVQDDWSHRQWDWTMKGLMRLLVCA